MKEYRWHEMSVQAVTSKDLLSCRIMRKAQILVMRGVIKYQNGIIKTGYLSITERYLPVTDMVTEKCICSKHI